MDPILLISILVGVVAITGVILIDSTRKFHRRRQSVIGQKLRDTLPQAMVTEETTKPYHFTIETDSTVVLVKMVWMNPQMELIVTNPDFWCVNANPKSWGRSSAPVLIPGVAPFRSCTVETSKKILKIGVVYPGCLNISRYLNESEVEIVKPSTDVHGCHLVRFGDLDAFFAKLEKK